MRTAARVVAAAVTALVALAGCTTGGEPAASSSPSAPAATTASAPPSVVPPSTPASTPAPAGTPTGASTGLVPGADCLTGTWRLLRFIGLGASATYGTGQGGDVTVSFDDGRYRLVGRGQKPYTVNLAGEQASLFLDGTADGTYAPDGDAMVFTVGTATGQGTLQAGNQEQTLPMSQVAQVVAPSGRATLACPSGVLLIALPTVRLELER